MKAASLLMAMEEDSNTYTDSSTAHNSVAMSESMHLDKKRKNGGKGRHEHYCLALFDSKFPFKATSLMGRLYEEVTNKE